MKETPSSGRSLIISYLSLCGREWPVGVGVDAYSRLGVYYLFLPLEWALMLGGHSFEVGSLFE